MGHRIWLLALLFFLLGTFQHFSNASSNDKSASKSAQQKPSPPKAKSSSNSASSAQQKHAEEQPAAVEMPSKAAARRILVAYAPDSKSHLRSMLPLINRLASAGHQMHVFHITSEKEDEKMHENVTLLRVQVPDVKNANKQLGERIWNQTLHAHGLTFVYDMMGVNFLDLIQNHPDKLSAVLNAHWDLVLVSELFSINAYAFAQLLHEHQRVPYVVFSPAMMLGTAAYTNAIGQSWVTHPHPFSPGPRHSRDAFSPSNVLHRLTNVFEHVGDMAAGFYIDNFAVAPRLAKLTGKDDFSFSDLYASSEMSIVDSIAYLAFPQPEVNEVLNAGAHCEQAAELPEDYRQFVEDPSSKGTVYIAFGTFIPWDFAPPRVKQAFFDAFERLPDYRFIFSFRGKFPSKQLPANIRLVSWAPQLDILAHPKTNVFITHCGLKSIKESLCSRTPMLAMPMFAEQNHNAKMVLQFGTGLALNKFNVDADQIYTGLKELLDNPSYGARVEKLQRIFLDTPVPVLDQAEFRVNRIMRKGKERMGRHFFTRKGIQLNWLEYFNVDLLALLISIAFFMSKN